MKRTLYYLLRGTIFVYFGVCAGMYLIQKHLLYFPTVIASADAEEHAARMGFQAMRGSGGELLAWRRIGADCATEFLVAHGNGGMALDRAYLIRGLLDVPGYADACVTLVEYPGYGPAPGEPGIEAMVERAIKVYDLLAQHGRSLVLVGESLGTGVVSALAAQRSAAGVLLITPYDDLASVAQTHYPLLPVRWLMRENLTPAETLPLFRGPVALIVAGDDRVIPPIHAQRLAQALPRALVHIVDGADHMDAYDDARHWWPKALAHLQIRP